MLPLFRGGNTAAASVLVRAGGLLEALIAYFEPAWEQGEPMARAGAESRIQLGRHAARKGWA